MPPLNSKGRHKDMRNSGTDPGRNSLQVHRVMVHLATVHLSTIDNLTAEDAIMTVAVAVRHGVAAVVQASAVHGTAVVAAAKCHGIAAAVAVKCHGTADEVDAACHGTAVAVAVAAGWIKTGSQIPGMTC